MTPTELELGLGEVPEQIPEFERPLDVEARRRRRGLPEFELELGEVPSVVFPTREEAVEMFEPTAEDLIRRVYPEFTSLTVDSFNEWVTTNPDAFVLDMVKNRGRTEDAEMLLRLMTEGAVHDDGTPYTQDEIDATIDEIFDPEPARLEIPEGGYEFVSEFEGIRQLFIIDSDYNVKNKDGEIVARFDPETGAIVEPLTPSLKVYLERPLPVSPPATPEEREKRVEAFRDYRKRGGKLYYDLWEKSGMPSDVTFAPEAVIGQLDAQRKQDIEDTRSVVKVFGEALSKIPVQLASSILQAIQGAGGASVVDQDWTNRFIKYAQDDLDKFISEVGKMQVGADAPIKLTDIAELPQSISFSLTSMGTGLGVGLPTALLPVPGARVAAYITGSAASGAAAYNMASYQIMQQYLEFKNEEQTAEIGRGLSAQEEQQLKEDFESKARAYGLWEAVPEAISNLAFFRILTAPLGRVAGQEIALKILTRLTALYGEEFITETITQKGQAGIEVKAGLRAEDIGWLQAFKEIAPQTFLLTTILGGTGAVTVATVNRIKKSLKAEIGPEHPSFQTIDEGITEESITRAITPEVVKPVEPKPEVGVGRKGKTFGEGLDAIAVRELESGKFQVTPSYNQQVKGAKRQTFDTEAEALASIGVAPPVAEVKPAEVTHRGAEPEGIAIGDELGIAYEGIQEELGMQFTDVKETGTTFYAQSLEEAKRKLAEKRKLFAAEVKPPAKPPAEVKPAPEIEARRAEEEIAGLKESLAEDPVAQERFTIGGKKVDLAHFISLKEQVFPDYFTVKQAEALFPGHSFAKYNQKGTPEYNKVPRDVALDDLTKQFNMTPDEIANRVMQIREERRRIKTLEQEARVEEAPPPAEVKPAIPLVTQMKAIYDDIQTTVTATEVSIKDLRGDEAAIAKETLSGLQRELAHIERTMESFEKRPDMPEATKLRSTIMAMASFKGLPKTQLQEIYKSVAGRRQLRVIKQEQLLDILEKVRAARPVRIGGAKVVTLKTEKKIQTLKESLISSRQMTNEIYNHLMGRLNLNTDRYEHANKFITETEAKDLIMAMNDEVVLAEWDIKVQDSLAKNPAIKEVRDALNDRGMTGTGVEIEGKPLKVSRGKELHSMRYYMLNLQKKLAAPIYDAWQKINLAHLVARDRHNQQLRRLQETTPNFKEIAADEAALKRIEDYIASKHNLAKIKAPELTNDEMAIATELERGYFEAQNDVRFIRFVNAYAENEGDIDLINKEIPSAPKAALRRAIDIYEGKGAIELRKFTDTQKWGVVEKGYDPRSFIKPILYYRPPKETTFAKGLLRTREGVEYEAEDNNIIQRYSRHQKQLIALQELSSLVRAFGRLYADHAHKLAPSTQRDVSKVMSRGLNEMKGYREDGGAIVHAIERLYGQVASAVFWRPDLVFRNKFQNFAFNPDFWAGRFLDPRNKPLTEERRRWFEVFVSQERVFQYDFLLYGEKPLPGFGRLTRWARRTSLYPWSDKTNRAEAFFVRINRVDRALAVYERDGNVQKLIDDSGLNELEPRQQAEALELLAMDSVEYGIDGMGAVTGREAFALYNTQQHVNNVHFLYDRSQRAPAEMGATGKTLGNILVFNRSWGERFLLQANKLSPESKANLKEKTEAVAIIVGVIVAGTIAGETYKRITGKEHNPYNPLNIITWSPGGLALGVTEDISNVIYLMTQAVEGDKSAFAALPGVISNVLTLTLPFYKNAIQAIDAAKDMKGIDVWAMRKIREMIDEEYEVRGGVHEVERTLLEKLQRAIFSLKDDPVTPQEKIEESESILGMDIEVADLPFTLEEPDIHDMRKLNTDLSRILKNVKPEEITKENDYSELAVAWLDKERYEAIWNTMPHKKIYEITELPEELAKWANRNKRKLALVAQYQKLEGAEAKAFLDKHSELKENPSVNWLKQFPIANARLALWGQTKIYTIEAYDEFNKLIKELDIPDDAIPELTLPPKGSVENYFKYQDMLTEFSPSSWEVQLLMAQDDELRQFLERQPIETPVRSLELKIRHRPLYEQYDLLETDEERVALKAANPEWVDDMRRIEAIENAASDETIESWVKRGNAIDEFGAGSSEAMVWLLDNQEVFDWALEKELLTDDGTDWNEPVLRINAKWRVQDGAYDAIDGDDQDARQAYLDENEEYRKDRRRREAFGDGFSEGMAEQFVEYWELPVKGFRQERFLLDNLDFASTMHTIKGIDLPKAEDVPFAKYDDIYEKHQDDFDKLSGLSDNKSPHYIENEVKREEARNALRYDARGNLTEFGKAEIRLEAYYKLVPEKHIENYVNFYSMEAKGYRQERLLKEDKDFYKDVWLGILKNDRIDVRKIPAKQYDDIYDQFKDKFDKWDAYKDPDSPLYIDDPDKRVIARQGLLDDSPRFAEAKIRREAYLALIGREQYVDDYVQFRMMEKPEGVTHWYDDDWFLQEHPEFHKALVDSGVWTSRRNLDLIPTREVFRFYEIYQEIDGTQAKMNYRLRHPELDKWGQEKFGWKPAMAQVDLTKVSKADIINAISRLSDISDEERARIEKMSLEEILDALSQSFQGKIQAFLNRGSLTKAEQDALERMLKSKESREEFEKLLSELEKKLRLLQGR